MDVVILSRWQFAISTIFHFLFVPLTLGLSILIAVMETIHARTGDETYERMAKFWGKLFLINFVLGVVTGITLEFQFGTNWSGYSEYVGDIFGSLLAIEATVTFFLESTFLAVWVFGRDRISPRARATVMWLVAAGSNLSAFWILVANAWMQHPVGYVLRNERAELNDFGAVVTQRFALMQFFHTVSAAYILSGFFVMGISAYHILRKNEFSFFSKSFRMGLVFALLFSLLEIIQGHLHGADVAKIQPAKLAAMESTWEGGSAAPLYVFLLPDEKNERNKFEAFRVPYALSLLAYHSPHAQVQGLKDFAPDERPPVTITFVSFRLMVLLGFLFLALTIIGWYKRNNLLSSRVFLRVMVYAVPLPYIACQAGWLVAEVGRQPWLVYGLMKTADAASPVQQINVAISLTAFVCIYSLLAFVAFYLIFRFARKGPEPSPAVSDASGGIVHA